MLSPQVKQILLVDDDAEECFIFKTVLHDLAPHITVTTLYDAEHLLESVQHAQPDLIFLDMKMPCKTGIDCLRLLKAQPALRSLPVIVYTMSAKQADIDQAYEQGAALYIVKPEQYPGLVDTLKAVLSCNWPETGAHQYAAHLKAFRRPGAEQSDLLPS